MKTVLLVGATGNLGSKLLRACRELGREVRALVRTESLADRAKTDPLLAAGAVVCEGSLEDSDSLLRACDGVDAVISAVGGGQIAGQTALIEAAVVTGVQRFIPSDFGIDPKIAGAGSCLLFDQKAAIHQAVQDAGLPYTFVHANGFFEYWVYSLGEVGLFAPPAEVRLYGEGRVKAALASVADVARVTAAAVDDPRTENRELFLMANVHSQEKLIRTWEEVSGRHVRRVPVSLEDVEATIAACTTPDAVMALILAQLVRSVWFRGDASELPEGALEASALYPGIELTSVREALTELARGGGHGTA